jgi:DeoR/GlpR family transcriptional regulator of sugar metabolism
MLARRRQSLILDEVRRLHSVRVSELTELLGVSDMTVRRDLDTLAAAGLLVKVHGGATVVGEHEEQHTTDEPGFAVKSQRQQEEKRAIAALAAGLVHPGTAIGITAGSTTWLLTDHLDEVANLIVVTNSVQVAEALHQRSRPDRTVVLTGGVRTPSDALVGPVAEGSLRSLHLDQVFMGVHGMSERAGFTTPNLMEAETNRAFVAAAQRLVVLADHTKWGTLGLCTITPLMGAHVVVTDDGIAAEARAAIQGSGCELLVADVATLAAPVPEHTSAPIRSTPPAMRRNA